MIDEKEIIRKEEVDFRGVINRLKRGWPVIALSLLFWFAIGILIQIAVPPYYTASTSVLTEEPKGQQDPAVLVTGEPVVKKPEQYYFNNQRIVFASFPLVQEAITRSGLIAYFEQGLLNREIYNASPFIVELDSTYMSFERHETPYETPFNVSFDDFNKYQIEVEGKYLVEENEYYFEGEFQFGEWVTFDEMKFRLIPQDTLMNPSITRETDLREDEYAFVLLDIPTQIEARLKGLEVINIDMESTVFTATLSGFSPLRQLEFLSALGDVFLTRQMELKTQTLKMALEFLNKEIEQTSSLLEQSEDTLKYFKSENSITNISAEGTLLLNQTAELEDDRIDLVVKNKYYSYLEETLRSNDDYSTLISPEAFGVNDGLLVRLTQELVDLQQDLSSLERQNAQGNPAYEQIRGSISNKRATILNSVEGFTSSNRIKLNDIEKRIREINKSSKEFPKEQSDLLKLERRFRINETLYTSLMDKKSNVELSLVSMTSDFRIIEPSHLTTVDPIFPWAPLTFILAILLGLMTGFGVLIFIWVFRNGIDSVNDIRRQAPEAQILSDIQYTNIIKPSDLQEYPFSPLANKVNALIYNLNIGKPDAKTIGISSYKRGEGKSFLASMLAIQYAQTNHRVLIIDANVRHPSIFRLFRIAGGRTEVNSFSPSEVSEATSNTSNQNIDILNLGKVVFNNAEVASFSSLLKQLSAEYDRIILDTAPVGNDSRSLAIINSSDVPIMVMRRSHTAVQDILDVRNLYLGGVLKEFNCVLTGTFNAKGVFGSKRNPYEKSKKLSLVQRIKISFARV
jgi:uncharacterized protein involved in exopolysaccharide biosynthesis/MinD superfamily P-loop ATPase